MMQIIADIRVQNKAELYEKLDAAVATAHAEALIDRRSGVLVTRLDFDHFSVARSPNIPWGVIHENDQVRRN